MLVLRRPSGFVLLAILSQRTRRVQSPADLLDRLAIQASVCNRGKTMARRGRSYSVNGDRRIWLPGCTDCAFFGNKLTQLVGFTITTISIDVSIITMQK